MRIWSRKAENLRFSISSKSDFLFFWQIVVACTCQRSRTKGEHIISQPTRKTTWQLRNKFKDFFSGKFSQEFQKAWIFDWPELDKSSHQMNISGKANTRNSAATHKKKNHLFLFSSSRLCFLYSINFFPSFFLLHSMRWE